MIKIYLVNGSLKAESQAKHFKFVLQCIFLQKKVLNIGAFSEAFVIMVLLCLIGSIRRNLCLPKKQCNIDQYFFAPIPGYFKEV